MKLYALIFILLSSFFSTACSEAESLVDSGLECETCFDWENHTPFQTDYHPMQLTMTDDYHFYPDELGEVEMSEASGIAWSLKNPGFIWAHNDSGHANNLFLIDVTNGEIVARYVVEGTHNYDWEDMEVSYGPDPNKSYIYLADTGDNSQVRPNYSIYRFEEPLFEESHRGELVRIDDIKVDRIRFAYPSGSYDTESMLVDPLTNDIFLITKRGEFSKLFVLPYPQPVETMHTIIKAGVFSFRQASAASSSISGDRIVIKNRQEIFYWKRGANESVVEMLARVPEKAPYIGEPQGEAICFDPDNNYYTLSEALNSSTIPPLYRYNLK